MVPLILVAAALAEPGAVRVAVSVGALLVPQSTAEVSSFGGSSSESLAWGPLAWRLTRVELGGGRRVQIVGVGQLSLHNAVAPDESDVSSPFPGDYYLGQVGAGVRVPLTVRRVVLSPRVTLGGVVTSSPISQRAWVEELGQDGAQSVATRFGAYTEAGLDAGLAILASPVSVEASLDVGYVLLEDVGLTVGIRVGLAARL